MFVVDKQPSEILPLTMSFNKVMPSSQTLSANSSVTIRDAVTGSNENNNMLVSTTVLSPEITAVVNNGVSGNRYIATYRGLTTPGNYLFESELIIKVKEQ